MRLAYHMMSSPLGLLFLARTERGLRFLEFMDRKSLSRVIAAHEHIVPDATWDASLLELKSMVEQLEAYFLGSLHEFSIPLDPLGSEFQLKVWNVLRTIPYAQTRTYGQIALAVGQPKASRAVGLANHDNPIAVVVPCHRVIGANGNLTGYGGGLPRKRWLLDHEARHGRPVGRTGDLFAGVAASGGGVATATRPATARATPTRIVNAPAAPARPTAPRVQTARVTPPRPSPARAQTVPATPRTSVTRTTRRTTGTRRDNAGRAGTKRPTRST